MKRRRIVANVVWDLSWHYFLRERYWRRSLNQEPTKRFMPFVSIKVT